MLTVKVPGIGAETARLIIRQRSYTDYRLAW